MFSAKTVVEEGVGQEEHQTVFPNGQVAEKFGAVVGIGRCSIPFPVLERVLQPHV